MCHRERTAFGRSVLLMPLLQDNRPEYTLRYYADVAIPPIIELVEGPVLFSAIIYVPTHSKSNCIDLCHLALSSMYPLIHEQNRRVCIVNSK